MKFSIFFLTLFFVFSNVKAQLIINEFSQGAGGAQEYIELVVVGHKSCAGDSCADIRGWIVDDNNGWYGAAGSQGIAPGHIRFSMSANWSCIPFGSIILLYNNGDKNLKITMPDDPYDTNGDHVYVLPSTSPLIEGTTATPLSPSSLTYVYPSTTSYSASPAWGALGLANTGDAVIVVNPTALNVAYHSIAYGNVTNGSGATVFKTTSGGARNYYLNNDQYTSAAAYTVGNAPADETPGAPNSTANAAWINDMLTSVAGATSYDIYACTEQGVLYDFNGTLLANPGVYTDTFQTSLGCDSVMRLHLSVITPTMISGTINSCQPVNFNGTVYPVSTIVNDTLLSSLGCDSAYVHLDIQIQSIITTTQWDTVSGCQSIVYKGHAYYLSQQITDTIKTQAGCDSVYKLVYLNIIPTPQINVPDNMTICKGASTTLTATALQPVTWDGYPAGEATITVTPDSNTVYTVHAFNELNCEGTASVMVYIDNLQLSLQASATQAEIGVPVELNVTANNNFNVTNWLPQNLFTDYHAIQQHITFHEKGSVTIFVTGESEHNCVDTASITINVLESPSVFIPTAFSPNGDGMNDFFKPQFIREHSIRDFSIFNRYGQKVYGVSYTQQMGNGWDGSFNGKQCDNGTYYYILSMQDVLGKETILKGNVTLVH